MPHSDYIGGEEMVKQEYPRLDVNLKYLRENAQNIISRCAAIGIDVAGVVKGTTGFPRCAEQFQAAGAKWIASSRLEQIEDVIEAGIKLPTFMLRVSMPSEVPEVIRLCDWSLQSEMSVIRALNKEAGRQGKIHHIILMADMGDLREGFWNKDEMTQAAVTIDQELENIDLAGIGTNVGCYGSILPTVEKEEELVALAEKIEAALGRKLQYISGGGTSSLMRVMDGNMPKRINHLRVGEGILLNVDLPLYYGYADKMSFTHRDVYTLKAEVIEVKNKPSHPVGEIGRDAFGKQQVYEDRGIRKRALLGIGKVDYGSIDEIFPRDKGIEILGASSDHTILDVEDAERDYKPGDIIEFDINYASIVYVTNTRNVKVEFID
jgi:predicted amino acid racemase